MKKVNKFLMNVAETFDLPEDVIAGLPRIELYGSVRFVIEPHKGLLSYSDQCIIIDSITGPITLYGTGLSLLAMNSEKISVSGNITSVTVGENAIE